MGKAAQPARIWNFATVPRICPEGTVVCIASGPSLTQADVDYCRGKADAVIVVNNCYQLAPWADVLVASDLRWWNWHQGAMSFQGVKYSTCRHTNRNYGVQVLRNTGPDGLELKPDGVRNGLNSGYRAVNVAVHLGAKRIVLLGYDMGIGPNKEQHWHPDHQNRTLSPYMLFLKRFRTLVEPLRQIGVEVVNCSRRTALDCFPKARLEDVLRECECDLLEVEAAERLPLSV